MKIAPLQQALCEDRRQISGGPEPSNWIAPSLPSGWCLVSYHFFVNWGAKPPTVATRLWMARQLRLEAGETLDSISKADILAAFYATCTCREFEELERIFTPSGQQVSVILLPEIPVSDITDDTPMWAIIRGNNGYPLILKCRISRMKELIQQHSGGPVSIGTKGLRFGTSAVECSLSRSDAAFPGDADAVVVDDQNQIRYIIEYKKHTIPESMRDHLVDAYYPIPDRRKYQRLEALATHYRLSQQSAIPLVVLYYSTRKPEIRLQQIDSMDDFRINIGRDSGDIPDDDHTSTAVVNWLETL
ncbi:hypothetical protein [Pantoea agglomerans]|uniref:hypothetical protein n=1 Tax=Enterobacter agglomerans TaxID=549 RepID=UPI0017869D4E|nr:hypothetical protein [Pantoea agglomerans]MBD8143813.1 hypothetical protein [Pantoea agglomerans]